MRNTKYLKDYSIPNYLVNNIELIFKIINENNVEVTSITNYYKNPNKTGLNELTLDGEATLISLELNNQILEKHSYTLDNNELTLTELPETFVLNVKTFLNPNANKTCMGLYYSQNTFLTQCEPEGFRKITYYLDRPDVTALFTTKIIAKNDTWPTLLSNGNKVTDTLDNEGFRSVTWIDPYKKPSYLFACVIGNLAVLKDNYVTKSGRNVTLEIYTDQQLIPRCHHAMESLKRSFKWDETRFNLEYDLDSYMILVSNSFNMGAMENKGLNVFNSKYVIANPETATDIDFINIEAVIGHEYFHNWTGNRVTCRDWFQLSLKEGLTVFRDQEFTSDLHNRTVKRIDDVKRLRQSQFTEDGSPLAHSVRPESYLEIGNFYTSTVYNKGAEVVRMYQTIVGKTGFEKGLSLYLKTNDGLAATCEDFAKAMSDANDFDFTQQFMLWYSQAGTPTVNVKDFYNEETHEYILEFEQVIPDTLQQKNKQPMLIPICVGLINDQGCELNQLNPISGKYTINENGLVLLLDQTKSKFVFNNIKTKPIPSLLRQFSAPIRLNFDYTEKDRLFLINYDKDEFNCFEHVQHIYKSIIIKIYEALLNKQSLKNVISKEFLQSLSKLINNQNFAPEFRALASLIPSFNEVLVEHHDIKPEILYKAITILAMEIGEQLFDSWIDLYNINLNMHYNFKDHGRRSLKNLALFYIQQDLNNKLENPSTLQLMETMLLGQYHNSDNMTDSVAVLNAINSTDTPLREEILKDFYNKWNNDELIMDKWLSIQALSPLVTCDDLDKLMVDKVFIATNPNKIYALLRTFLANGLKFNTEKGYSFIVDKIIAIDKFNPSVASILAQGFSNTCHLDQNHRYLAKIALQRIVQQKDISNNVFEIVSKIINGLEEFEK